MPNPLFNGMNNMSGGNPLIQNIMNAVNMARNDGNPQEMLNKMAQQNPQAAQQIQSMLQSGQNPMNLAISACALRLFAGYSLRNQNSSPLYGSRFHKRYGRCIQSD